MSNYSMGEYIKRRRKELGIKQIDLCQGICDRGTLSRIELGKQSATKYIFDALMQRLGIVTEHYASFLTTGEFKIEELKHELANAAFYRNFEKMNEHIREIEASPEFQNPLVQRLVTHFKTIIMTSEQDHEKNLELLRHVICATKPNFNENKIAGLLLSVDEVKIINNIANIYSQQNKHDAASKIYAQLIQNLESAYMDSEEKDRLLTMLFYNYSRALGLDKKYEQSIQIAQNGVKLSLKYGRGIQLARLYVNIAYCLYYLNCETEGFTYLSEAVTLQRILKLPEPAQQAVDQFRELLNVDIN